MRRRRAGLGSQGSTAQAQHQEECALAPDAAVGQRAVVSELGAAPDQALLGGRDALPVQQHQLDGLDRVAGRHVKREGAARGGLDEDLHACKAWPWACVSACAERLRRRRGVGGLAQCGHLERACRRRSCCSDDRGGIVWVSGWGVQVSVRVSVRVSVQNSVWVSVRVSVRVSVWVSVRISVRVGVRVSVRVSVVRLGLGRAAPGRSRGEGLAPPTR